MGGIHWGIAFENDLVYARHFRTWAGLAPGRPAFDPKLQIGMYAVDANTGEFNWHYTVKADCEGDRGKKAPDARAGLRLLRRADGHRRGRSCRAAWTAACSLWTARPAPSSGPTTPCAPSTPSTGCAAKGGAFDSVSIVGVNGLLLAGSGYGIARQAEGNVLLAFKPKQPATGPEPPAVQMQVVAVGGVVVGAEHGPEPGAGRRRAPGGRKRPSAPWLAESPSGR